MGLLDDAIREHLDLKRRRGADPAEIERAEQEALGPVRRGPEETAPDDLAASAAAYDQQAEDDWGETFEDDAEPELPEFLAERPRPLVFDDEHEQVVYEEDEEPHADTTTPDGRDEPRDTAEPSGPTESPSTYDDLGPEPVSAAQPEEPEPEPRARPAPHPAPAPHEPESEPPPPAPSSRRTWGAPPPDPTPGETAEYDVEHALRQEGDNQADDVLEETPEFLQDTPDHDRLWFEQKPPRDFDFNG
jgi:hypothetical protein